MIRLSIVTTLAVMCLSTAALAKKSRVTLKNCTDRQVWVLVYNGDDAQRTSPRRRTKLQPDEQQRVSCKVSSGKKRCWIGFEKEGREQSGQVRVKDDRTLYITAIWNNAASNGVHVKTNPTSCAH